MWKRHPDKPWWHCSKRFALISCAAFLALCVVVDLSAGLAENIYPLALPGPFNVYLTLAADPLHGMDVHYQTEHMPSVPRVLYDVVPHNGEIAGYAHEAPVQSSPLEGAMKSRWLHHAHLAVLTPGTTYYFVVGSPESGYSPERRFQTLPQGDKPLRFVEGGDIGNSVTADTLLTLAAAQDPDFALLGGDLAYANDAWDQFDEWDEWFSIWCSRMVTPDGNIIPFATCYGNHEISKKRMKKEPTRRPYLSQLLGPWEQNSYRCVKIGDQAALWLLDTGYLADYQSQATWLESSMAQSNDVRFKFACYHEPLYPGYGKPDNPEAVLGQRYWAPIFDKYDIAVAFEHHDHLRKRTKPIRENKIDASGTVYVGDGPMGSEVRAVPAGNRWYIEQSASQRHFWCVDVFANKVEVRAVGENGEVLDAFSVAGSASLNSGLTEPLAAAR